MLKDRRTGLALVFLLGAILPLTDLDLPLHLLVGEWIVQHRAFPTVEPFAWTRAGEPYFAYSWLPQIVFYLVEGVGGALGLRILHGLIMAAAAAAMAFLARSAGWTRNVTLIMVVLHIAAFDIAVPSLRPQEVLFVTVPIVWGAVLRLVTKPDCRKSLALLLVASTVSAASHLFFPIVLVPLAALFIAGADRKTSAKATAAIIVGWLLSPYAFRWIDVYRLNFAPNVLLGRDSPIAELKPGFGNGVTFEALFVVVVSVAIAWGMLRMRFSARARIVGFAMLAIGVAAFAYATRLSLVFWLLCAPVAGHVLSLVIESASRRTMKAIATVSLLFLIASIVRPRHAQAWIREGLLSRSLVWPEDTRLRPTVRQFRCLTRLPASARVYASLQDANVLAWRWRPHSMSIDSRTIFPDSVARAEVELTSARPVLSADIAVLHPEAYLAADLRARPAWKVLPAPTGPEVEEASAVLFHVLPENVRFGHYTSLDRRPPVIWLNTERHNFGSLSEIEACAAGV